jgi:hypothetical protein
MAASSFATHRVRAIVGFQKASSVVRIAGNPESLGAVYSLASRLKPCRRAAIGAEDVDNPFLQSAASIGLLPEERTRFGRHTLKVKQLKIDLDLRANSTCALSAASKADRNLRRLLRGRRIGGIQLAS